MILNHLCWSQTKSRGGIEPLFTLSLFVCSVPCDRGGGTRTRTRTYVSLAYKATALTNYATPQYEGEMDWPIHLRHPTLAASSFILIRAIGFIREYLRFQPCTASVRRLDRPSLKRTAKTASCRRISICCTAIYSKCGIGQPIPYQYSLRGKRTTGIEPVNLCHGPTDFKNHFVFPKGNLDGQGVKPPKPPITP